MKKAKQTSRLVKTWCETCGYTMRVSKKWLLKQYPECPTCNLIMEVDFEALGINLENHNQLELLKTKKGDE